MASAGAVDIPVNDEGWPLSPAGYEVLAEVGQGAFAKVLRANCPSKGTVVAIKVMMLENISTSLEEIQAEVRTMKLARHENILDLYCCFVVGTELWLIMPLMDKGSCYFVLKAYRSITGGREGQGLPEDIIATILREMLQGLDYIHSHHQIHRDLKAGNILLNSEGRVVIADFGVSGWLNDSEVLGKREETSKRSTFVGTPCWMAPEVMEQTGYNEKADIWSVGITALELFKGYAPYAKLPPMQVLIKTMREPPPGFHSYTDTVKLDPSAAFRKFVERCLIKDSRARPSAHELLGDAFLRKGLKTSDLPRILLDRIPTVGSKEGKAAIADAPMYTGYGPLRAADLIQAGTTWSFPAEMLDAGAGGAAGGEPEEDIEKILGLAGDGEM